MVKNKARDEGSICGVYLDTKITYFCSYYFEPYVPTMRTRCRRNEYELHDEALQTVLSILNYRAARQGLGKQ